MPLPTAPAKQLPKTARERVYRALRQWIMDGTLQPEEKIYDLDIAKYFQVSRTPVREAIQLLADQELIEITPGKESRIAPLRLKDAEKFYQMLAEFNVLALQFAYSAVNEAALAEMEKANKAFEKAFASNDRQEARNCDESFHAIFFRLAAAPFLQNFTETLKVHVNRIEELYFAKQKDLHQDYHQSVKEHQAIIQALKSQDLKTAEAAMRSNWLSTLAFLQEK